MAFIIFAFFMFWQWGDSVDFVEYSVIRFVVQGLELMLRGLFPRLFFKCRAPGKRRV